MNFDTPTSGKSLLPIALELNPHQALALAQLCKRIGWAEVRQNAVDDDEAHLMLRTLAAVQMALGKAGFAPR
ncbi:DUF7706 family protein [Polaromonas sp. DSR2-3-2]|uniref:DUF7706 family protein n=1 Tax=unclassified Polaromonas TaxID=2638319 RepID=UPI003CEE31E4